jgi:recombinational DNA repair protein RecR
VLRGFFGGALAEHEVEQLIALLEKLPGVGAGSCAG